MHHSGPLPPTFEGLDQGFGVKTAKMGVRENLDMESCLVIKLTMGGNQAVTWSPIINNCY